MNLKKLFLYSVIAVMGGFLFWFLLVIFGPPPPESLILPLLPIMIVVCEAIVILVWAVELLNGTRKGKQSNDFTRRRKH